MSSSSTSSAAHSNSSPSLRGNHSVNSTSLTSPIRTTTSHPPITTAASIQTIWSSMSITPPPPPVAQPPPIPPSRRPSPPTPPTRSTTSVNQQKMARRGRLFQRLIQRQCFRRAPSTDISRRPATACLICQKTPNHSTATRATRITRRLCPALSLPRQLPTTCRVPSPPLANPTAPTAVSPPPSYSPPPIPPPTPPLRPAYPPRPPPPVPLSPRQIRPRPRRRNKAAPALARPSLVPPPPSSCQSPSGVQSPIATRATSRQTGSSTT